ncbi:MAG: YkgJ family cysteine cluster protein [Candidatus Bathyarchaeota archaeon]|nr:YkgJ family cysteine cluster protein [Candidatus Bathyarchaeota archaeon]
MRKAGLIPWTEVNNWSCIACGNCCLGYRVPLKMDEMVKVNAMYGPTVLEYGMGKAYLRNQRNGRCVFQRPLMNRWICTLQGTKPTACRLFPFRIHSKPIYKRGDQAGINLKGKIMYLYMDPDCQGIIHGQPSDRFRNQIVPEIISMGMGLQVKQKYTTSRSIHWRPT